MSGAISDRRWSRALGWIVTPVYLAAFGTLLSVFQILQILALRAGGLRLHRDVLDLMNRLIILNLRCTAGMRFSVRRTPQLPPRAPVIFVANHQSMYDIPFIMEQFRSLQVKFIAKRELARGVPSVSYALRHHGSALIDRGDHRQAIAAIREFAAALPAKGYSACIFPEGTRARDGTMKRFKPAGFAALYDALPDAPIVPIVIDGSWELLRYKFRPIPFGVPVRVTVLPEVARNGRSPREVLAEIEATIRTTLGQPEPVTESVIIEPALVDPKRSNR